jgi:ribosomal protein S21
MEESGEVVSTVIRSINRAAAVEVEVRGSIDPALRLLHCKPNREVVFAALKLRARYIEPGERQRQKLDRAETPRQRVIPAMQRRVQS